jgi:hypothetical protein
MKNRLFYVLIFLTLIIAGCEKESQEDFFNPDSKQEMTSSNDFHDFVQMVSYKKVANELDIKKILASVNADKNVTHKSSQANEVGQFEIDTNFVSKIQYEKLEYLSYTFKIKNRSQSKGLIENLLIEYEGGISRTFLISYKPNSSWAIDYLKGIKRPFQGKIIVQLLDGNIEDGNYQSYNKTSGGCTYVTAATYSQCTCVGHWPGESCTCPNQPNISMTTIPICSTITEVITDGTSGGTGGGDGTGSDDYPTTGLTGVDGDDSNINTAQALISMLDLNSLQSEWISNNNVSDDIDMSDILYSYVSSNDFSGKSLIAVKKALVALMNNPYLSWDLVENWFLNLQDALGTNININPLELEYSEALTQQPLPSWSNFLNHFPKVGSSGNYETQSPYSVYYEVGGTLWSSYQSDPVSYGNACAIRGSRGLLYSGIQIPVIWKNSQRLNQRTQKGGDSKNYVLDAITFNQYMIDKFGDTPDKLEGQDANDPIKVANFLSRKNGIYVIVNSDPSAAQYNGHVDAIINGKCISNAYTTPEGGVKSIRVWKLQ